MTPRARVLAVVAAAGVLAAGGTVGFTLLQTRGETTAAPGAVTKPRSGTPPVFFTFGVRADPEARDLLRAADLLDNGKARQAAVIFGRYRSLQAQIGTAFAAWRQGGGLDELKRLFASHSQSPVAELHLGYAYYWSGRNDDALASWEHVAEQHPDSPEAVQAESLLYPRFAYGLPPIVAGLALPSAPSRAAQLSVLERAAAQPDANAKVRYGLVLWQLWHRVSAERQFDAAARLAPDDPVARTAAAVGAFTKRDPVRAFGRLGPLTAKFPRAAVVRFHLGVLLLWTRQPAKGVQQFKLAVADAPRSLYAEEAQRFLAALRQRGTK
jgi:tetratricopeptide (TPR) repeat protein